MKALNELARALLSAGPLPPLDDDLPLVEQGFGSLLGVELCARLESALPIPVPPTVLFNYPDLRRLAAFLSDSLRATTPELPSGEPEEAELALLNGMSERELQEFIDRELRQA